MAKIRLGFVSNSSSSSFCILGVLKSNIKIPDTIEDVWDLEDKELSVKWGIENYYEDYCIGITPMLIKENETILEAKKRVVELLKNKGIIITVADVNWRIDGGYNG